MPAASSPTRSRQAFLLAAFAGLGLAGCAGGEQTISSAVKPVASVTGFATTAPEPVEFVQKSRPASQDYLAVGVTPPARTGSKILTKEELAKAEQDLETTRSAHDKLAGRKPSPPGGQVAAKAKLVPKKQGETGTTSQ